MSILIAGKSFDIPGIKSISRLEDPIVKLNPEDYTKRQTSWVRSIFFHTTIGDEPVTVTNVQEPDLGLPGTITAWQTDRRHAGAHLLIDLCGTLYCLCDLLYDASYHATTVNQVSIGIEIKQAPDKSTRQIQYDVALALTDFLTKEFGIQRQFHWPYLGDSNPVKRLAAGGKNAVGIFGHRDQTDQRGKGDPGDYIFRVLHDAGYERMNFELAEDIKTWWQRQTYLGIPHDEVDGIPGMGTRSYLINAGYRNGIWVQRPGD